MWNGHLWEYVHYQRKEETITIALYNNLMGLNVHYNAHNKLYEFFPFFPKVYNVINLQQIQ